MASQVLNDRNGKDVSVGCGGGGAAASIEDARNAPSTNAAVTAAMAAKRSAAWIERMGYNWGTT